MIASWLSSVLTFAQFSVKNAAPGEGFWPKEGATIPTPSAAIVLE